MFRVFHGLQGKTIFSIQTNTKIFVYVYNAKAQGFIASYIYTSYT